MSYSAKYYTTGNMEKLSIYTVTSQTTNFPKEHLIDNNLDTAWRPSGESAQDIILDAGQSIYVQAYILWVQNYKRSFATSADPNPEHELYYSDVGTSGPWTSTNSPHYVDDWLTPIRLKELDSPMTKRYWKIAVPDVEVNIHVSGLWLCRLFELDQAYIYPDQETSEYHNAYQLAPGGRIFTRAINRAPVNIIPRTYKISQDANRTVILSMFDDTQGRRHPLFLQEGTLQKEARFVYLMTDRLDQSKVGYQLWDISLPFQEMPYIDDGETY